MEDIRDKIQGILDRDSLLRGWRVDPNCTLPVDLDGTYSIWIRKGFARKVVLLVNGRIIGVQG